MPSGEECAGAPPRSIARVDCKPVRMMIIECFGRLGYFFCARHADGPQARQAGAGRAAAQTAPTAGCMYIPTHQKAKLIPTLAESPHGPVQSLFPVGPEELLFSLYPSSKFSGVATGGKWGNLPPPPTSDRTPREIDADPRRFLCQEKFGVGIGIRFTGFAPTFYLHRREGGCSLVLRLRKKRGL